MSTVRLAGDGRAWPGPGRRLGAGPQLGPVQDQPYLIANRFSQSLQGEWLRLVQDH